VYCVPMCDGMVFAHYESQWSPILELVAGVVA